MESRTDKDGPIIQQTVIEQGNPSEMSGDHQFTQFCVEIPRGELTAGLSRGSSYFEWSIVTDPAEIDGFQEDTAVEEFGKTTGDEEHANELEFSDDEEERNGPDEIYHDNIGEAGIELDHVETPQISSSLNHNHPNITLPAPGPLKEVFTLPLVFWTDSGQTRSGHQHFQT